MQDNFIKIGNIIYNINYIESIKFSEPALMLPHEDFLGSVQNYKYVEVITKIQMKDILLLMKKLIKL